MNKKLLIIACSLVALFGSIYIASEHIAATKKANYNAKAFQYETVKIGEVIDYLETNTDIKYILVSETDNQDSDYLQQVLLHNLSMQYPELNLEKTMIEVNRNADTDPILFTNFKNHVKFKSLPAIIKFDSEYSEEMIVTTDEPLFDVYDFSNDENLDIDILADFFFNTNQDSQDTSETE